MVDTPAVLQGAETPSGSAKFSPSQLRILVQRRSHGHPEVFLLLLKVVAESRGRISVKQTERCRHWLQITSSQNQEVADRKSLKCRCYSSWWFTSDIGLSSVSITGRNRSSDRSKRWKEEEVFLLWSVAPLQRMSSNQAHQCQTFHPSSLF